MRADTTDESGDPPSGFGVSDSLRLVTDAFERAAEFSTRIQQPRIIVPELNEHEVTGFDGSKNFLPAAFLMECA